ncbi:hypothetical protein F2P81_005205 [Scophthalmus maximus]|uniref:Uncharacterized protein n=1 Tax=Scophthalmus maximus TaxID=52904 RepID=A0A6A4T6M7_SCOMX|nr:hypothetical protein F2P81_005205 [Scophthalmus maximus]
MTSRARRQPTGRRCRGGDRRSRRAGEGRDFGTDGYRKLPLSSVVNGVERKFQHQHLTPPMFQHGLHIPKSL